MECFTTFNFLGHQIMELYDNNDDFLLEKCSNTVETQIQPTYALKKIQFQKGDAILCTLHRLVHHIQCPRSCSIRP